MNQLVNFVAGFIVTVNGLTLLHFIFFVCTIPLVKKKTREENERRTNERLRGNFFLTNHVDDLRVADFLNFEYPFFVIALDLLIVFLVVCAIVGNWLF